MKILTIIGTRPEIIRLSRVISLLDEVADHVLVHTGQNFDYELNEIFFKELGLRQPDYFLNVDTSSLGKVLGETLSKTEEVLLKEEPDAVLILGDTNSSVACIMAKRLQIPTYHMEAGNRCFDLNVPEEINRRIIDHTADFNLVYTESARRHLLSEGLPDRKIYLTGSPLFEVINYYRSKIEQSDVLTRLGLEKNQYFLVSSHRQENVDKPKNLETIIDFLNELANKYGKRVIFSTHPRTRNRLKDIDAKIDKRIEFHKPFGFTDFVNLELNACCTISDSGTISEESAILNFPAVTMREATERPEAIDSGTITLTGLDSSVLLDSIALTIFEFEQKEIVRTIPAEYQVNNTSWRVVKLILGTAKLNAKWDGLNKP